jgi:hypothetical protein
VPLGAEVPSGDGCKEDYSGGYDARTGNPGRQLVCDMRTAAAATGHVGGQQDIVSLPLLRAVAGVPMAARGHGEDNGGQWLHMKAASLLRRCISRNDASQPCNRSGSRVGPEPSMLLLATARAGWVAWWGA